MLCTPVSLVSTAPRVPLPPCLSLAREGPGRVNHWATLIIIIIKHKTKSPVNPEKLSTEVDGIIIKHCISLVSDNAEEIKSRHLASVCSQG